MSERGCWVYGVTDHDAAGDLSWPAGVAGTPVRAVRSAGLTALVSDVDLAEFGADALHRNLEDLEWLERVARAHHTVIDAASRSLPMLPMRLATVYSGEPSLASELTARRREFREVLARVRGRVEWGVKAYAQPQDKPAATSPTGASASTKPGTTENTVRGRPPGAGMAYLKRRREELTARREGERDAVAGARAVHAGLAGLAAGARLHAPQSPQLSGARTPMLLNAAYLLDSSDGTGFAAAVASVADAHPELRLELTGPWPPYSFTGGDA